MRILWLFLLLFVVLAAPSRAASPSGCSVSAASPWIERWLGAWELTSKQILKLPDAAAPNIVFFDSACVYTTSEVAARGARAAKGPKLHGVKLSWRAVAHGDSLTLPDGSTIPLALMSFTNVDKRSGPFFVMSAPSYWAQKGHGPEDDPGLAAVFIHEFAHTRQVGGMGDVIGPIDSTWPYPEELNDDAVQTHFSSDSVYVAAYLAERDLLYRAAGANTQDEVRVLAKEALAMIRARHARWFTGDQAEFAILDDAFLSMEGAAQWAAAAWLAHPKGGKLTREAAVTKMLGRRRWWVQDESLEIGRAHV